MVNEALRQSDAAKTLNTLFKIRSTSGF